jgi:hypothetical protein
MQYLLPLNQIQPPIVVSKKVYRTLSSLEKDFLENTKTELAFLLVEMYDRTSDNQLRHHYGFYCLTPEGWHSVENYPTQPMTLENLYSITEPWKNRVILFVHQFVPEEDETNPGFLRDINKTHLEAPTPNCGYNDTVELNLNRNRELPFESGLGNLVFHDCHSKTFCIKNGEIFGGFLLEFYRRFKFSQRRKDGLQKSKKGDSSSIFLFLFLRFEEPIFSHLGI